MGTLLLRPGSIALAALLLCGCSHQNDRVCSTPQPLDLSGTADQVTKTDSCIHRWAYRLSSTSDDANEVAAAVIGGCQDAVDASIVSDRQAIVSKHPDKGDDPSNFYEGQLAYKDDGSRVVEYRGENKGWVNVTERDNDLRRSKYQQKTLFYVIQSRAGKCSVP